MSRGWRNPEMKSLDREETYSTGVYREAFQLVGNFIDDFQDGVRNGRVVNLDLKSVEKIVFMGIGGSGIVGDVAAQLLSTKNIESTIVRGYHLPRDRWDLAVAISHSGNTAETIKTVLDLIDRNVPCVFITSGGMLSEIAVKKGIPIVRVKGGMPPRYCFPNMFGAVLGILEKIDLMRVDINIDEVRKFREKMVEGVPTNLNPAKQAAIKIVNSNPLVYVYDRIRSIGYRLKCQLNENAKMYCGFGEIPEVLHNEVEAIGRGNLIVLPRVLGEDEETREVIDTLIHFFGEESCLCLRADSREELDELLELFMLMDYISLYAAVLRGVDPLILERIPELRRRNKVNEMILKRAREIT